MTTPAPPAVVDGPLGMTLRAVLACLCEQLREDGRPVCRCCPYFGDKPPPADDCQCECAGGTGRAWVRLVELNTKPPMSSTGSRTASGAACGPGSVGWFATIEMGVYRCVDIPDDGIGDCDTQSREASAGWADAASLRRVVSCCEALEDRDADDVRWRPSGPSGGCAGSTLTFTINA